MKRYVFFLLAIIASMNNFAQEYNVATKFDKKVNLGIKAGFNTTIFWVNEFKIKDITINEIQNNFKIGQSGAVFLRFNMKKHFIEPELSLNISNSEIQFDKNGSQHPDITPDYATINSTIHTIELPILYGYNFVKSGPYGMAVFGGPKLKYTWDDKCKIRFDNFDQKGIQENLFPFNISIVTGVGVNISNIFFDFRYELGLSNISKSVTYIESSKSNTTDIANMVFKRRCNLLSFSLGVIF